MDIIDSQHIKFSKFHGAGNDFIMINAMKEQIVLSETFISEICNRRTGIGADGLIILLPSDNHDFKMKYYNCDGKEATFCGNGGRCITAFAFCENIIKNEAVFEAADGIHKAEISMISQSEYYVNLSMCDILSYKLTDDYLLIDTGSPHYVKKVDDIKLVDVVKSGAEIRYDKNISENGVNVDFLQNKNGIISIRTYERGVEDETLACGTGVTASAIAASLWFGGDAYEINTQIARFKVSFAKESECFKNIVLSGPATHVFDGIISLNV